MICLPCHAQEEIVPRPGNHSEAVNADIMPPPKLGLRTVWWVLYASYPARPIAEVFSSPRTFGAGKR